VIFEPGCPLTPQADALTTIATIRKCAHTNHSDKTHPGCSSFQAALQRQPPYETHFNSLVLLSTADHIDKLVPADLYSPQHLHGMASPLSLSVMSNTACLIVSGRSHQSSICLKNLHNHAWVPAVVFYTTLRLHRGTHYHLCFVIHLMLMLKTASDGLHTSLRATLWQFSINWRDWIGCLLYSHKFVHITYGRGSVLWWRCDS